MKWAYEAEPDSGLTGEPAQARAWGDVVLARKETPTSYHLAVVVDDALQGVTHVVRGRDLLASSGWQRSLQAALGLPGVQYAHIPLVTELGYPKLVAENFVGISAPAGMPAAAQARAAGRGRKCRGGRWSW